MSAIRASLLPLRSRHGPRLEQCGLALALLQVEEAVPLRQEPLVPHTQMPWE
jgi:hypothetical protein